MVSPKLARARSSNESAAAGEELERTESMMVITCLDNYFRMGSTGGPLLASVEMDQKAERLSNLRTEVKPTLCKLSSKQELSGELSRHFCDV